MFAGAEVYDDMDREDEEDEDDRSSSSEESSLSSLADVPAISPPSTDEEGEKAGCGEGVSKNPEVGPGDGSSGDGPSHGKNEPTPDLLQGQSHKELNGNSVENSRKSESGVGTVVNGKITEECGKRESIDASNIPDVIPIINIPSLPKDVQE